MKSSSTNNNNKKFHLIINGDKRSSYLFVIATIPVLVGITGAFWDLTYHTLNKVDTFFQPAHLVIYNSIFAALLIGIVDAASIYITIYTQDTTFQKYFLL